MANFQKIKELCSQKNMTIRELADKIGIRDGSLHDLIRNNTTTTTTIETIARVLEVPVGTFFDKVIESIYQDGDCNAASIYGDASVGNLAVENKHLKELLAEKNKRIELLEELLSNLKTKK